MSKGITFPIIKYRRRIPLSTSLFTYSIVFLILFVCLARVEKDTTTDMCVGFYTIFGVLMAASLAWMSWNTYWIVKRSQNIAQTKQILAFMWVPLIGIIANLVILKRVRKAYKLNQSNIDSNGKQQKEPMPVVILLVVVTFVVVLAIWLVYASLGTIPDHQDPSDHSDHPAMLPSVIPGIIDVLISPIRGFISGAEIIIFLLIMGVFMQMVNQSKALEAGIGGLVRKLKGKELIIIPVLMVFFSIGGATFGFCEETIAFYAIVMPIVLAAGFDVITGVLMILFGAGLGVCASVINPFMIMTSMDASNNSDAHTSLTLADGIAFRLMIYFLLTAIGIVFTMLYARKVKANPKKSLVYDLREIHQKAFAFDDTVVPEFTTKRKIILVVFMLSFVVLIIGVIPWDEINITFFINMNNWLVNNFPFLATSMGAVGAWELPSLALLFLAGSIIIAALNWTGVNNFYREVLIGAKDFLNVAFVIAVAKGLSIILSDSGVNVTITDGISDALKLNSMFGTIAMFMLFILLSIFIPSTSGFAYSVFGPIAAPSLTLANLSVSGGIASASMANGIANLFAPTAPALVIGCEMAKVPLKRFYKSAWKLLLIVFVACIAMLVIGYFLPDPIMGA